MVVALFALAFYEHLPMFLAGAWCLLGSQLLETNIYRAAFLELSGLCFKLRLVMIIFVVCFIFGS